MEKGLISIIIPGYNEELVVENTINSVEKVLGAMQSPYEILIVDDGSTDRTTKIIKRLLKSKKHPNLRLVSYKDGPSRRENLAKSFRLLKGSHIILLDMDLSMDLKHLKEMLHWLQHGYDIVIPNRYHSKSDLKRNPKRYMISKAYNSFIRLLFRTGLKDNICGFKAFQKKAIDTLLKDAGIDKSRTRSVFWDTELLIHAIRRGMKIKEIPVHWEEGKNSALTFKREAKMLPYIIKFWLSPKNK